jgi:hypothetical protein
MLFEGLMHHKDEIQNLVDEIPPIQLYVTIAYLQGDLTLEQAVAATHSHNEYFLEIARLAREIGNMYWNNEKEIYDILHQRRD